MAMFERTLLDGVQEKCLQLRMTGCILAIASNQGGIRKELAISAVEDHLQWVCEILDISAYCYAWEEERKKPQPTMLQELMAQFQVSLAQTCLVGDAESDRQATVVAGFNSSTQIISFPATLLEINRNFCFDLR
jgi:HAD superfamily hydrolase (TIGR01662 family)